MAQKIILFIILSLSASVAFSQQLPIFSIHQDNSFALNPAIAGSEDHGVITLSYRDQWSGINEAPTTQSGSYRTPIYKSNIGLGAYIMNDVTGPTAYTGLTFAYAYHIPFKKIDPFHWAGFLRKSKISLGLSLSVYQYRLKSSELKLETEQLYGINDPAISSADEFRFLPNAGVGIYYYYDNFYLGFSAPQLIPLKVKFNGENGLATIKRVNHYYVVIGGKIPLGGKVPRGHYNKFYIEPMVWFKHVRGAPYQIDGHFRLRYKNKFWGGAGYRTSNALILEAGFLIRNQFKRGYAYDLPVGSLSSYLGSTHEIILAYHFRTKKMGQSTKFFY